MRIFLSLFFCMLACTAAAGKQAAPAPSTSVTTLAPVMVSGAQPGPGLWKVTSPEGHVLWVLGTLEPLPRGMQWQSGEVLERLAQSQELLREPSIELKAKLGFFGKLALLPRLIGVRNNPDHARLADVVPPATYARWQALKARYIGHDGKVEKWRPLFAGFRLYDAAIERAGMDRQGVAPMLLKAAKNKGVKIASTAYVVTVDDPKALLTDFKRERLDDLACFGTMLDQVEVDLARMGVRANAWASGDLQALRAQVNHPADFPCANAVNGADFARKLGLGDFQAKMQQAWLAQARRALAANRITFALLPIDEALKPGGHLASLEADGYAVQAPDAEESEGSP